MFEELLHLIEKRFRVIKKNISDNQLDLTYENVMNNNLLQSKIIFRNGTFDVWHERMPESNYSFTLVCRRMLEKIVVDYAKKNKGLRLKVLTGSLKIDHLEPEEDVYHFGLRFSLFRHLKYQMHGRESLFYTVLISSIIFFSLSLVSFNKNDMFVFLVFMMLSIFLFGMSTAPVTFLKNKWAFYKYKAYL